MTIWSNVNRMELFCLRQAGVFVVVTIAIDFAQEVFYGYIAIIIFMYFIVEIFKQ